MFDINNMINEIYNVQQRALNMGFSIKDLYLCLDIRILHHLRQFSHKGRFPDITEDNDSSYLLGLKIIPISDLNKGYHICIKSK